MCVYIALDFFLSDLYSYDYVGAVWLLKIGREMPEYQRQLPRCSVIIFRFSVAMKAENLI